MQNLSIVSYRIKDIYNDSAILGKYKDPYAYIKGCDAAWLELLKNNPYAQEEDIALILTVDRNTVVGRLGLYAASVKYNQKQEKTFWLSGFFLNEAYKNSGAGGLMLLKAINFFKCLVAAGGPRIDTQGLYKATGFSEIGALKRYVYFYNAKVIAKRYIKNRFFCSLLSFINSPLLKLYYRIRIGNKKPKLIYQQVEKFNTDIDELVDSGGSNYFPKYSNTLNWILQHRINIYAFQILRNHKLVGCCLLRRTHMESRPGEPPHYYPDKVDGSLLDYYLADSSLDVKKDLVLFCIDFFKEKKMDIFEFQIFDEEMERICLQYGMIHLGGNRIFFRPSQPNKPEEKSPWFLTHGTADEILIGE